MQKTVNSDHDYSVPCKSRLRIGEILLGPRVSILFAFTQIYFNAKGA
jgi:hypothetical protein